MSSFILLCMYIGSALSIDGHSVNEPNITCSSNFYLENSTCFPICQEWSRFSDTGAKLVIVSAGLASVLGLLGGIAVIVGSIIRYKSM